MLDNDELDTEGGKPPFLTALVASVCDLKVSWLIFLRRNILRRVVSNSANAHAKAHASTESEVRHIRA